MTTERLDQSVGQQLHRLVVLILAWLIAEFINARGGVSCYRCRQEGKTHKTLLVWDHEEGDDGEFRETCQEGYPSDAR